MKVMRAACPDPVDVLTFFVERAEYKDDLPLLAPTLLDMCINNHGAFPRSPLRGNATNIFLVIVHLQLRGRFHDFVITRHLHRKQRVFQVSMQTTCSNYHDRRQRSIADPVPRTASPLEASGTAPGNMTGGGSGERSGDSSGGSSNAAT